MRGETMKDKSKKSTYSTTFGVDPCNLPCRNKRICAEKINPTVHFLFLGAFGKFDSFELGYSDKNIADYRIFVKNIM